MDLERRRRVVEVLHRRERRARLHVVQHGVAVRERAALGVLAGEADRDAVDEQRCERERLGVPPVDAALVERRRGGARAACSSFGCGVNRRGRAAAARSARAALAGDGGDDLVARAAGCGPRAPAAARGRSVAFSALVRGLAAASSTRSSSCVGLPRRDDALLDERLRVLLAHGRMLGDRRGHAAAACTRPRPARCGRGAGSRRGRRPRRGRTRRGTRARGGRPRARLGVVGVDVDDRDVEALGEVARVARRAALARVGREADLVVRDQVQRAAGRVAVERREVERLGDDALAGERRVAVDQDRQRDRRVVEPSRVERSVCSARARPSTTGSTASRWLGFAARVTVISPAARRARRPRRRGGT